MLLLSRAPMKGGVLLLVYCSRQQARGSHAACENVAHISSHSDRPHCRNHLFTLIYTPAHKILLTRVHRRVVQRDLTVLNHPCVSEYLQSCDLFMNSFQIINIFVSVSVSLNCTSITYVSFLYQWQGCDFSELPLAHVEGGPSPVHQLTHLLALNGQTL